MPEIAVRRVLDDRQTGFDAEAFEITAPKIEEGPQKRTLGRLEQPTLPRHPAEPEQPGAAHELQSQGLHLVVAVMRRQQKIAALIPHRPGEEGVAPITGPGLERAGFRRRLPDGQDSRLEAERGGDLGNAPTLPIRALAQAVVDVEDERRAQSRNLAA